VRAIRQHLYRSVQWKGNVLGILEMRRHYSNYLRGYPDIKEFRNQLVHKNTTEEIEVVLEEVMSRYSGAEVPAGR
jgi:tRNA-dihydrouridine synthase